MRRPTGITIIGVLSFVAGVILSVGLASEVPASCAVAVPPPSSVIESVASLEPAVDGANCTVSMQVALAASV